MFFGGTQIPKKTEEKSKVNLALLVYWELQSADYDGWFPLS